MKYYELTYPNHTTLLLKSPESIGYVLVELVNHSGLKYINGAIYNPLTFLTLNEIDNPSTGVKHLAQELSQVLIG